MRGFLPRPRPAYTQPVPRLSPPARNTLAYVVGEVFWGLAWALTVDGAMVAAFRDDFQGPSGFVGLTWFLASFGLGIPLLLAAFWVEPMRHKRAFVFWGHLAGAGALFLMAILIHLSPDPATTCVAYLVANTLFFVSVGLLIPGWLALVGELFPAGTQARVLGLSFFANKVAGMFAGEAIASQVLATSWAPADKWTLLFGIAGLAGVIGSFPFLWIVETPRERPPRASFPAYLRSLVHALRDHPVLRRFIAADAVGVTVLLTLAFYADAAIQADGFANHWSGHWVAVGAVAQLSMSGLIAWTGAAVRPRTWMAVGLCCGSAGALAAACGGSHLAYDIASGGVGVYMMAFATCRAPEVMRLTPSRDGTAPIGIAVALLMPVQGIVPLVTDAWIIPVTGYGPVFVTVAVLGVIAAILLLLWVPRNVVTTAESTPASGRNE